MYTNQMMNETNSQGLFLYQCEITEVQDLKGPDLNNTQACLTKSQTVLMMDDQMI